MAYGSVLTDVVQSSTAGTPPQFNDGNGTQVGTLCRAWVNFNGTGTVAIRASFNVSSITDNGTGDYTVNFTNALSDANYSVVASCKKDNTTTPNSSNYDLVGPNSYTTNSVRLLMTDTTGLVTDMTNANVAIFR